MLHLLIDRWDTNKQIENNSNQLLNYTNIIKQKTMDIKNPLFFLLVLYHKMIYVK